MKEIVILGQNRVQILFAMAPKIFSRTMTHWMWRERKLFLGNKKYDGSFRRSLNRKQRKYGDGEWSSAIGKAFTGEINHPENLNGMQLRMGISDRWQRKIPYAEFLGTGGTITPKNKKWLMIPNYKNLRSIGLFGRVGGTGMGTTKNNWSRVINMLYNSSRINPIAYHGKLLYFGNTHGEKGTHQKRHLAHLHDKLLFTGVKRTKVKKQFDFIRSFERRIPGATKRAETMINRTVKKIDSGVLKGVGVE
jgi:hypothetical protein